MTLASSLIRSSAAGTDKHADEQPDRTQDDAGDRQALALLAGPADLPEGDDAEDDRGDGRDAEEAEDAADQRRDRQAVGALLPRTAGGRAVAAGGRSAVPALRGAVPALRGGAVSALRGRAVPLLRACRTRCRSSRRPRSRPGPCPDPCPDPSQAAAGWRSGPRTGAAGWVRRRTGRLGCWPPAGGQLAPAAGAGPAGRSGWSRRGPPACGVRLRTAVRRIVRQCGASSGRTTTCVPDPGVGSSAAPSGPDCGPERPGDRAARRSAASRCSPAAPATWLALRLVRTAPRATMPRTIAATAVSTGSRGCR